ADRMGNVECLHQETLRLLRPERGRRLHRQAERGRGLDAMLFEEIARVLDIDCLGREQRELQHLEPVLGCFGDGEFRGGARPVGGPQARMHSKPDHDTISLRKSAAASALPNGAGCSPGVAMSTAWPSVADSRMPVMTARAC